MLLSLKNIFRLCLWGYLLGSALAAEPETLHLLCWTEYVPTEVLESFRHRTGSPVATEYYRSNEEMLAKLRAKPGYYDLIQPSGFYVETLAKAGELEALDQEHLPHAKDLLPEFRHLPFDPDGRFSIPWMAGTVGIVVDTTRVHEPITTWADVFNGHHRGHIVVVDDSREMLAWALASLGQPITEVGDAALAQAEPVLREWLPQVAVFDSDSPSKALLDGRAEIGIVWSGEAALLWEQDHRFQYVLPAAGAHRFVDSLAVPHGAPHRALAEQFIDFCLEPEVSSQISAAYPYTNPNGAGRRLLSAAQLANPASYPPGAEHLPMLRNEGHDTAEITAWVSQLRGQIHR